MSFNSKYKDGSQNSIGFQFIKVYNLWSRSIKTALIELDLTHPQFVVLASLGYLKQFNDEVTQIMVSKNSNIDAVTVSQIIRNLEKKKLIERKSAAFDTRAKTLSITEKGHEKLSQALHIVESIDEVFFGQLNRDERKQFTHHLECLGAII